jgi:oxygen-independent coproporphyrinogen-3 oxidase
MSGVYLSIPFCAQKCTYCNFSSEVWRPGLLRDYLAALEAEILAERWGTPPETLYLGGGTPSLLDAAALGRLLRPLPATAWREATIEASPGSVTPELARAWRFLGLNRVSLGVQSFAPREIAAAGRRHTPEHVATEVHLLRQTGLHNVNIDLIAGLAWQTPETWRRSLQWVERISPPHVSVYMLEVDRESRLGREVLDGGARYGAPAAPDPDTVAEMYLEAVERLQTGGWSRYEISNFARPGFESVHNRKYWNLEPYRGFGADAHSCDSRWRWSNVETAAEYVARFRAARSPVREREPADPRHERFFVGLRQTAGIEPTGEEWSAFAEPIARLAGDGLLERSGSRLRLTARGVLLSNFVFQEFLP